MQTFIKIHPNDNVIVALQEIPAGTTLAISDTLTITAKNDIPSGHKMSITDMNADTEIIKDGSSIGFTKENISCGEWVHVHNLKTGLGDLLEYHYEPVFGKPDTISLDEWSNFI